MEAPRWSLRSAHYLNVPTLPDGTRVEWEHKETARDSGRTVRKLFTVPMLLDPRDPADCNYPGEIIVTRIDNDSSHTAPRDYIFVGDPTPEMDPLNEAAEAITAACRHRWDHPIESLPANGGMSPDESAFMAKMMEAFAKATTTPADNASVPREQYDALLARITALEAATKSDTSTNGRRV